MFKVFRKFFASRRQRKAVADLAASIARMQALPPAPKGKRWLLGLDNQWSLVDVPRPDPARKAAPRKRKARAS